MNRYFFYPVVLSMLGNTILYVPSIIIAHRFEGSVPSLLISVVVGSTLAFLCTNALSAFPGKGLPEILSLYFPSWIKNPFLLFLGLMWFMAGSIVLITYARVIQRFLNPDFNLFMLMAFLIAACSWVAAQSGKTVLFVNEVILVLNVPLIAFILLKSIDNENMDWDAVRLMRHYWLTMPNWSSLAAGTYIFTGYINWVVFNREFRVKRNSIWLWTIPVMGTIILTTTFIIPIGYHGTIAVGEYIYPWVSTADSMRIQFGFVERILYVFLLLYLSIALLFVTTVWHAGTEMIKGAIPKTSRQRKSIVPWSIFLFFAGLTLLAAYLFNEKQYLQITDTWFQIRLPVEIFLVMLLFILARKERRS